MSRDIDGHHLHIPITEEMKARMKIKMDGAWIGRELTTEQRRTYDEVFQAYKRKWIKLCGRAKDDGAPLRETRRWRGMRPPSDYAEHGSVPIFDTSKDKDIAYDEMLKYLDDSDYTAPLTAKLS